MRIIHAHEPRPKERCGIGCIQPSFLQRFATIRIFVALMCFIIAIQGTYLGYAVGVLTSIERRFELSSSETGLMLSMYDIGHTGAVLIVGYCGGRQHKPRWTAAGVGLSAIAMVGMVLPVLIYGPTTVEEQGKEDYMLYVKENMCDKINHLRPPKGPSDLNGSCAVHSGGWAYIFLLCSQLLAGVAAAPFNTLAYVYIDDNVDHRSSPLYLGLLTSMYAFGPAFGFGLAAICNSIYVSPGNAPAELDPSNATWIGCWWLGYVLCAVLYLLCLPALLLFPYRLPRKHGHRRIRVMEHDHEMSPMNNGMDNRVTVDTQSAGSEMHPGCMQSLLEAAKAMPSEVKRLLYNRVFVSMTLGWIFGSFLIGGYSTYLPKYIETQYLQSAAMSDLYAGLITIGSIAISTALGGYILTRFNMSPTTSILCLIVSWSVILATYLLGLSTGCAHPKVEGQKTGHNSYDFDTIYSTDCNCRPLNFDPICVGNKTYFSPCYAGCLSNLETEMRWFDCLGEAQIMSSNNGFCEETCWHLPIYLVMMFLGLFFGNLFFMTTMMIVLRAVLDDQKSLALSLASFATNIFGFIPGPILFGVVIDSTCAAWHSNCPNESGNCIMYDNQAFKRNYHLGNALFQLLAILSAVACYFLARNFKFPEEDLFYEDEDEFGDEPPPADMIITDNPIDQLANQQL